LSNTTLLNAGQPPAAPTDEKIKPFTNIFDFLFRVPLYDQYSFDAKSNNLEALLTRDFKVDGYCPFCKRQSTFFRAEGGYSREAFAALAAKNASYVKDLIIECVRRSDHKIRINIMARDGIIQKVGQFPSFADIANDESKQYRDILSKEDAAEFHKAIGLAAHGVGIGAYVYIRRIFERLIQNRFAEFKDKEGWSEAEFEKLRMAERIEFLKDHLPEFLVKNKKLYGILSLGIHELNEADCLGFFSVIRASTIYILDEDKRKKEELAQRKAVEAEIERFVPPKGN
jgi:hypothetical protein